MREKIGKFIKNCLRCIMCSPPIRINEQNLYNIPKKPLPFDTIHIDHFGPLPSVNSQRKHILVVIDGFTKFVKLFSVKSTSTKEVIACLDKYFANYSRPRRIISDRGTCFTSSEFSSYLLSNNIDHVRIAVASAQANGQVERVNRVLKAMLSKVTNPLNHADWSKMLVQVEYAINNTVHCSAKQSPSKLLFGVDQRSADVDFLTNYLQKKNENEKEHSRDLEQIRRNASESITKSQERNLKYFLERSKPAKSFNEGDFVVIRYTDTTVGRNKKLNEIFRGPYVIHKTLPNDRYVIRDIENCQITQLPYDGIIEASRIRKWIDNID